MSGSTPTPIAIVVVRHAGRVLIGQRPPGVPLAGFWEFPGGKVRPGETLEEASARECREETGLELLVGQEYLTVAHDYAHGPVELHFFAATPLNPSRAPIEPFRWVPVSELPAYRFPPANARMIERLVQEVT